MTFSVQIENRGILISENKRTVTSLSPVKPSMGALQRPNSP